METFWYRSSQYYESKVLHNTVVTWFSTAYSSSKTKSTYSSLIQYASFGTFKAKIGRLLSLKSTLQLHREIYFLSILKLNGSKVDSSRNFEYWFWSKWSILALKVSKEAYWIGLRHFLRLPFQYNRFLRNCGPLKIRLLQGYEVLWIHNIDAICTMHDIQIMIIGPSDRLFSIAPKRWRWEHFTS